MIDLKIHSLLKIINENPRLDIEHLYNLTNKSIGRNDFFKTIEYLEKKEYSDRNKNGISITKIGETNLSLMDLKIKKDEKDEKIKSEKLYNDAKLSKWQRKTFWWFFGIAIFGGLYSGYDIIKNLSIKENPRSKQVSIEQMESELSKLRTLILDQKSLDSLNNSSLVPNSLKIN